MIMIRCKDQQQLLLLHGKKSINFHRHISNTKRHGSSACYTNACKQFITWRTRNNTASFCHGTLLYHELKSRGWFASHMVCDRITYGTHWPIDVTLIFHANHGTWMWSRQFEQQKNEEIRELYWSAATVLKNVPKWVNVARVQGGQPTGNQAATLDQYQNRLLIITTFQKNYGQMCWYISYSSFQGNLHKNVKNYVKYFIICSLLLSTFTDYICLISIEKYS